MDREQFDALVARMEVVAKAHPAAYQWRVLGWAALGFGFLALMVLALLVALLATLLSAKYLKGFSVKLLVIVVPALFVVARSMWVRFDPPEGPRVTREESPQLFAMLDELRSSLRTPRIHAVVITHELNAAVTQIPRLGFLGWHRNFLMLGLPLMKGLTVEQFKAVLAHELGHLSRGHARIGNWIYRLRMIWARLEAEYSEKSQLGASAIRRFFHWYSPRFNATSFPLARANEYEADAASAQLTSPQCAAQALTGISVLARFMDQKYWPGIHQAARDRPEPAFSPYAAFRGTAVLEIPEDERASWLSSELARATSTADTHPALKDRLAAIGCEATFAPPTEGTGAEVLLGNALVSLERGFDDTWRQSVAGSWKQFHVETQAARARLAQIRDESDKPDASCDELLERADLEERVGEGREMALGLRHAAVRRFPDSIPARHALGKQLLGMGEAEGVSLIEPLVSDFPAAAAGLCELLRDYYWSKGDQDVAHRWHDRLVGEIQRERELRHERDVIRVDESYVLHGLTEQELAPILHAVRQIPAIRRAYLVRKPTRNFPDEPFFVFGYACTRRFALSSSRRIRKALQDVQSKVIFPGETMIISVEGEYRRFEPVFRKVRGSRIR
jgi:Zn-dependent protease with chaperone function